MNGINKVILIGTLGADPDSRVTPAGQPVCEMRMATNERWTDKDGDKQERTEWHRVVVWGKQAEACGKFLTKGRQVYVEGRIQTRSYDDKDGNKRYITEIVANDVQFLGKPEGKEEGAPDGKAGREGRAGKGKVSKTAGPANPWDPPADDI